MVRIEIELGMWESAPCPIYTGKITDEDLEKAERELYDIMCHYYRWNKEDVNRLLKGIGETDEIEDFKDAVCKEEEVLIMNYGGKYYEDMSDEELSEIAKEYAVKEINAIGELVDEIRDKFHNLRINVSGEELEGRTIEIDGEVITLEEIDKYMNYLEEIRKFALYV